jgi:Xaa-Pro dipeptidase
MNQSMSREQALWDAQLRAEALFERVIERGLIQPGCAESELNDAIYKLARQEFGVRRHWHRRVVRCGQNTILTYFDEAEDRRIMDDDIVFLDFGPVFEGWEADLARSYVVGSDPEKHRMVESIGAAFQAGQMLFESQPNLTSGELYDYVASLARAGGWQFGATSAGHPVDAFPHKNPPQSRLVIEHGNEISLHEPLPNGEPRHWILEIHFVDRERRYGAFCEELLTIRGPRPVKTCR